MRVLIAPDCFGGTLSAPAAAAAIADGWTRGRPQDTLQLIPQSDGGPGFVSALSGRGQVRSVQVSGPLPGQTVDAAWVFDTRTATAYLESAQACGLALLGGPPTPDTAVRAGSAGVGELVGAALAAGARRMVVGLGGSGCTDGGQGLVEVLGGLDVARRRLHAIELIAATDVDNPLLGPRGAAAVFGPQKGADPPTVAVLEQRLTEWAHELDVPDPVSGRPGAGAAGGLGAALLALGGRRESGATIIAAHTGLASAISDADVVITGEGRFDEQSLRGKVVSAVAALAAAAEVPVLVLAGQLTLSVEDVRRAGIGAAHAVVDVAGSVQRATEDAAPQLAELARRVAAGLRE